jgi:bacterioferritin-associated ferredoxin
MSVENVFQLLIVAIGFGGTLVALALKRLRKGMEEINKEYIADLSHLAGLIGSDTRCGACAARARLREIEARPVTPAKKGNS